MADERTTYWDYIAVESLLSLQGGLKHDESKLDNDEVLFITVHQIDELWFKLALRELVAVRDLFARAPVPEQALASAVRGIRRVALLMSSAAQHFSLMETMTTRDYLAFRDKLMPASGFQSAQLREIEILMGLDDAQRIGFGHAQGYLEALRNQDGSPSPAFERVRKRLGDLPNLKATLYDWLHRTPIQGSTPDDPDDAGVVQRFIEDYVAALTREAGAKSAALLSQGFGPEDRGRLEDRYRAEVESARAFLYGEDVADAERERVSRIRAALVFIESYRELPLLAWPREVVDGIVALEQAFLIFRQRHARMVERVIGRRTGTGGSSGVDYLDQTALQYRVFGEVWAVRTLLVRKDALPPLTQPEFYDFAGHG
jgi:tryptophan 2,3-dioxygenase